MPLVPQSTYAAWFSTGSWVYKHYSFLYANPLYTTRVPRGASLCPYWWAALFSLFVFRPLVYVTLGAGALVKALHLGKLIAWTDRFGPTCEVPVMPTVLMAFMIATAGLLLTCFAIGVYSTWVEHVFTACWLWLPCVVSALLCGLYAKEHECETDRCKVEVYNRIVLGAAVILAFVFEPVLANWAFFHLPAVAVQTVWAAAVCCAVGVYSFVKYLLVGIAIGASHIWIGLIALVVLATYGWLVAQLGSYTLVAQDKDAISRSERKQRLSVLAHYLWFEDDCMGWSESRWLGFLLRHCSDLVEPLLKVQSSFASVQARTTFRDAVFTRVVAHEAATEAARAARIAKCKEMSTTLTRLCAPVVWVWRQGRILGSYLWQLVRASKTKSCPYLTFTDPAPKQ